MRTTSLASLSLVSLLALAGCPPSSTRTDGGGGGGGGGSDGVIPPDLAAAPPDLLGPCGLCAGDTPVCDVASRKCVGCLADKDCPAATVCKDKRCVPGCSVNRSECGDAGSCDLDAGICHGCLGDRDCKDPALPSCDLDSGRCQRCSLKNDNCPAGSYCAAAQGGRPDCVAGCKGDTECKDQLGASGACCNHVCADTAASKDHCGACGAACQGNNTCCRGACKDTQADAMNCGGCGARCPSMNNQPTCANGKCGSGACLADFADCDQNPQNGCEIHFASDRLNCGACGMMCSVPNGNAACVGGACGLAGCLPGFRDCNMDLADGCEANIQISPTNCGVCGANCKNTPHAAAACAGGTCVVGMCDMGWGNCNKIDNDGCESELGGDILNCGACGNACKGLPNVQTTCINGVCGVGMGCLSGFKDCDGNAMNGCEVDLLRDPKNCGGCGTTCGSGQNGVAACAMGNCTLTCNMGFGNCDGNNVNGCEAPTSNDRNNCGQCNNVCPMNAPICQNSMCGNIVRSCKEVLDAGLSIGDGVYTVDPDGMGGNAPIQVYCDMTTDGGGWTVIAFLRAPAQWNWGFNTNNGMLGDVNGGFSSGLTLLTANDTFNEKIIIYKALVENGANLGKQWMLVRRADNAPIPFASMINNATGWSFRDSYNTMSANSGNVCTHGCTTYRGHGMFHDSTAISYHGTQGGDYGCRDGNNICWRSRGLGCNVGSARCANLTGNGEGVIYAVRKK